MPSDARESSLLAVTGTHAIQPRTSRLARRREGCNHVAVISLQSNSPLAVREESVAVEEGTCDGSQTHTHFKPGTDGGARRRGNRQVTSPLLREWICTHRDSRSASRRQENYSFSSLGIAAGLRITEAWQTVSAGITAASNNSRGRSCKKN